MQSLALRPVDTPHLFTLRMRKEPHTGKGLLSGWRRERMTEQLAKADVLPSIAVPLRLQDGEHAYYSSRATRCGEPIKETLRTTYPAQDHGLLILTDRRLLFIGRKSQLVLDYVHLLHISRLEGTLAFEADHWQKRAIFSMPQPETCAARLEAVLETTARCAPGIPSLPGAFGNARKLAEREAPGRPGEATATATTTQITVPNPCLISATADEQATTKPSPRASRTSIVRSRGKLHATPTHTYPQHTPTPVRRPSPSPTHPAVTPMPVLTPTPSSIPSPTVTPTQPPTPTSVPAIPPTPVVTPTTTPVVTATNTVTPVDTATATVSPGAQPTETSTAIGSPTVNPTLTGTAQSGHTGVGASIPGGFSPFPRQADTGGASASSAYTGATGNCLGDTLLLEGPSPLLLSLQLEFWVILSTSLAGTIIFCGMLARAARASAKS